MSFIRKNIASDKEIDAWNDKVKQRYDGYKDAGLRDSDMILMSQLLNENFVEKDGAFHSKSINGNTITTTADSVSSNTFSSGPDDSPENIVAALEMTVAAKAFFEDDQAFLGGTHNEEQMAIMAYAADLVGLEMLNRPDNIQISDELKTKMDAAWDKMQVDLGVESAPTIAPESGPEVVVANTMSPDF